MPSTGVCLGLFPTRLSVKFIILLPDFDTAYSDMQLWNFIPTLVPTEWARPFFYFQNIAVTTDWFLRLVLIGQYCIKFPKLAEGNTGWGLLSLPVNTLSRRKDHFLKAACYSSTGNGFSIFSRCCKMLSDCLLILFSFFYFFPFETPPQWVGCRPSSYTHYH